MTRACVSGGVYLFIYTYMVGFLTGVGIQTNMNEGVYYVY
jgi:hypothetical protein